MSCGYIMKSTDSNEFYFAINVNVHTATPDLERKSGRALSLEPPDEASPVSYMIAEHPIDLMTRCLTLDFNIPVISLYL